MISHVLCVAKSSNLDADVNLEVSEDSRHRGLKGTPLSPQVFYTGTSLLVTPSAHVELSGMSMLLLSEVLLPPDRLLVYCCSVRQQLLGIFHWGKAALSCYLFRVISLRKRSAVSQFAKSCCKAIAGNCMQHGFSYTTLAMMQAGLDSQLCRPTSR